MFIGNINGYNTDAIILQPFYRLLNTKSIVLLQKITIVNLEEKILGKNKLHVKSDYDVSKNSIKLSLPKPARMQRHKYYLRSIGYEEIGKHYYNEMQYGDFFMINYTLHGAAKLKYDNIEFSLRPGDLCFLYTYQRRIFRPVSDKDYDWSIYYIHFFGEDVKDFFNGLKNDELIIVHDFPREQIEPYIKRMLKGIKNTPSQHLENKLSQNIYRILLNVQDHIERKNAEGKPQLLQNIVDFIEANYSEPITLDDIVKHSYFSKSHLNTLFLETLKTTPMQFVLNLRLQKAQQLLMTTNLSLKKVAALCGFKDERALIYAFRTHLDTTPSDLRKNVKKEI